MNPYEVLVLTTPSLSEDEQDQIAAKYTGLIEQAKGTVRNCDKWGKRVLAYPINKISEGVYTLIEFTGDASLVKELDRRLRIDEVVMRHMIVNQEHDLKLKARSEKRKNNKRPASKTEATDTAHAAPNKEEEEEA